MNSKTKYALYFLADIIMSINIIIGLIGNYVYDKPIEGILVFISGCFIASVCIRSYTVFITED